MNLVLIGPQGCGKGTQAEKIVEIFELYHVEAGGLIRKRAQSHDKKAVIINHLANQKGQLLPDGVVLDMIFDELDDHPSSTGYLFDGYPRTITQYEALKGMLAEKKLSLNAALYIHISDEETVKRLGSRRLCRVCQKGYSLLLDPGREKCDCGGELVKREDDEEEAITRRLALFHENTQPILNLMRHDEVLVEINGEQPVDKVFEEIQNKLVM